MRRGRETNMPRLLMRKRKTIVGPEQNLIKSWFSSVEKKKEKRGKTKHMEGRLERKRGHWL